MAVSQSNPSLMEELKRSDELSMEDILRTKAHTFPPLKRHVIDMGFVHTTPLIELFQLRIDKFHETNRRGELYGKIEVVDSVGSQILYLRERGNPEHIHANSTITLKGPTRPIELQVGFAVNIELLLRDDGDGCDDFVLSKWQFSWDAMKPEVARIARGKFLRDFCDRPDVLTSSEVDCRNQPAGYDQPLVATFEGSRGCLTMYYAALEHACQAWIKIEVVDVNIVSTVVQYNARGRIFAKYGHFEHKNDSSIAKYCKTELLKTNNLESVKVECWKEIHLSRFIVAIPAYSSLVIEANLWDTSSNLKIGQGKVEFIPSQEGLGVDNIRGDDNLALRVMVCWCFPNIPDNFPFPSEIQ